MCIPLHFPVFIVHGKKLQNERLERWRPTDTVDGAKAVGLSAEHDCVIRFVEE